MNKSIRKLLVKRGLTALVSTSMIATMAMMTVHAEGEAETTTTTTTAATEAVEATKPVEEGMTEAEDSEPTEETSATNTEDKEAEEPTEAPEMTEGTTTEATTAAETTSTEATTETTEDKGSMEEGPSWVASDFTYDGNKVTGFSESGMKKTKVLRNLILPTTSEDGTKITTVADGAFEDKRIVSVHIPEGYETLEAGAFAMNRGLTKIEFPSSLKVIGDSAFSNCSLAGNLVIPETVNKIGATSFYGNAIETLDIKAPVTEIEEFSFKGNLLKSVTLPDTVTTIGLEAFAYNHIKVMDIPKSVTSIVDTAFIGNKGYKEYKYKVVLLQPNAEMQESEHFIINPDVEKVDKPNGQLTVDDFTYAGTTITGLTDEGYEKLIESRELILPDTNKEGEPITEIGMMAFANRPDSVNPAVRVSVKKLHIPETVTEIGMSAFQDLKLTKVEIPKRVKTIGMMAFMENPIETLILHEGLETIEGFAFAISNIKELDIPASVTSIGMSAFMESSLERVNFLGDKVTILEDGTFGNNFLTYVVLPEKLESIGSATFAKNLLTEVFAPNTLTAVATNAFANNPGEPDEGGKVIVWTENRNNPNNLSGGSSYVVDPSVLASEEEKDHFKMVLDELKEMNLDNHSDIFKDTIVANIKGGDEALAEGKKYVLRSMENEIKELLRRSKLDILIAKAQKVMLEAANTEGEVNPNLYGLRWALDNAANVLTYLNMSDLALKSAENRLLDAMDLVTNRDDSMRGLVTANVSEGSADVPHRGTFDPFKILVKVFHKNGKIVAIDTGNTQTDRVDDSGEEEDDNRGYFNRAIRVLPLYEGLSLDRVKAARTMEELGIKPMPATEEISKKLHEAIVAAINAIPESTEDTTETEKTDTKVTAKKTDKKGMPRTGESSALPVAGMGLLTLAGTSILIKLRKKEENE